MPKLHSLWCGKPPQRHRDLQEKAAQRKERQEEDPTLPGWAQTVIIARLPSLLTVHAIKKSCVQIHHFWSNATRPRTVFERSASAPGLFTPSRRWWFCTQICFLHEPVVEVQFLAMLKVWVQPGSVESPSCSSPSAVQLSLGFRHPCNGLPHHKLWTWGTRWPS